MRRIAVVTLLLALPVSLAAQLPDPSIRSLGMGGAQTASRPRLGSGGAQSRACWPAAASPAGR